MSAPERSSIEAGAASVELPTPMGTELGGYAARVGKSTGRLDPLMARAVEPVRIKAGSAPLAGIGANRRSEVGSTVFPPGTVEALVEACVATARAAGLGATLPA